MARDRLKRFQRSGPVGGMLECINILEPSRRAEAMLCLRIGRALAAAGKSRSAMLAAWNAEWRSVYALANLICDRHMVKAGCGQGRDIPDGAEFEASKRGGVKRRSTSTSTRTAATRAQARL